MKSRDEALRATTATEAVAPVQCSVFSRLSFSTFQWTKN